MSDAVLDLIQGAEPAPYDVVTRAVIVTPEMAKVFLGCNDNNREVSAAAQKRYELSMLAGEWLFNGESIVFDRNGQLLNGQHRLRAIVSCRLPVPLLLVYGVEPEAFTSMDCGMKRTVGQVLKMKNIPYYRALPSIARSLFIYDRLNRDFGSKSARRIPNSTVLAVIWENPGLLKSASYVSRSFGAHLVPSSALAFSHFVFRRIDSADADIFAAKLGWEENTGDANIAVTRNFFREMAALRVRMELADSAKVIFTVWNAFRKEESVSRNQLLDLQRARLPEPV